MWEAIKNANRAVPAEESVEVRVAVLITVMIAVVALLTEQLVGPTSTAAALIGIPLGYYVSHRMRNSDALGLKSLLALALIAAVGAFMVNVAAAVNDGFGAVQLALAELFLWVQVIHSMHVPARRDLLFSLASSGVMFAISSALSIRLTIAPFIVIWAVGLVTSLVLAQRSSLRDANPLGAPRPITDRTVPPVARSLIAIAVLGTVVFMFIPAARSTRSLSFPSSLQSNNPVADPGQLSNPSLGEGGNAGGAASQGGFDGRESFGYFGFAEQLDTSLRGRPDESMVMRVRASAPAFWRGQSFDTWDGRTWTQSRNDTLSIGGGEPIGVPRTLGDDVVFGEEFIQTFYLERGGPNIVFGAYRPTEVYFPDRFLFQLPDGALRTGVEMEAGTVYTVVSSRPIVTAEDLRAADPLRFGLPPELDPYLQVPDSTPQRVLDLAADLAADAPTTYDTIRAFEEWMALNTTYSLDIPPLPDGADAVDHYLFQTQQGFCEQIGTSLVVMLRSQGIPARLVVGFTPGERNPFTGLYEVRGNNAHSWAEVYFPGLGWQGFDPTAFVPLSGDTEPDLAGSGLASYIGDRVGRFMKAAPIVGGLVLAFAFIGTTFVLGTQILQRRRREQARSWADRMFDRLESAGGARGAPRAVGETLREYAERLRNGALPDPDLGSVIEAISTDQLGPGVLSNSERVSAERTLDEIVDRHPARTKVLSKIR